MYKVWNAEKEKAGRSALVGKKILRTIKDRTAVIKSEDYKEKGKVPTIA